MAKQVELPQNELIQIPKDVRYAIIPVADDKPITTYPVIAYLTPEDVKRFQIDEKFQNILANRCQDQDFDESEQMYKVTAEDVAEMPVDHSMAPYTYLQ